MHYIVLLYITIPAFVANMMPVIAARTDLLRGLALPMDGGRTWRGRRILGDHKTWRGLVVGAGGAVGVTLIQFVLSGHFSFPGEHLAGIGVSALFGLLAGLGAIGGDAAKSFVKRRIGIASGRPFIPFDQVDYIAGFLFLTAPVVSWTFGDALFLLVFAAAANPLVNFVAYVFGIKNTYW